MTRLTVWCEEPEAPAVREIYPEGLAAAIAAGVQRADPGIEVRTSSLDDPGHGLDDGLLEQTDVLAWWGHHRHHEVPDLLAEAIQRRVLRGMGLLVLHSGHLSRPFGKLMGTSCNLRWREADDRELVFCVAPPHPIARGVSPVIEIPRQEMYGEYFDIPAPDELVFISSFSGGEVFRSGCCFYRGKGRIFYFSPGHETYPVYHQPEIQQVLANAARWAHVEQAPRVETSDSLNSPVGWYSAPAS
jgi:trehalose utilization protein